MARKLIASFGVVALVATTVVVLLGSPGAHAGPTGNCVIPDGDNDPVVAESEVEVVVCEAIDITKEVTGDAAGRTFPVTVECAPADVEFQAGPEWLLNELPEADFPPFEPKTIELADGETKRLLAAGPVDCTITEDPPEGCELVSIDPATVQTSRPNHVTGQGDDPEEPPLIVHEVTVVNDCPPEAEPAAADVVQAQPAFTG